MEKTDEDVSKWMNRDFRIYVDRDVRRNANRRLMEVILSHGRKRGTNDWKATHFTSKVKELVVEDSQHE